MGFPAGVTPLGEHGGVNQQEKQHTNEIISERTDDFLMETWEPREHLIKCEKQMKEFEDLSRE